MNNPNASIQGVATYNFDMAGLDSVERYSPSGEGKGEQPAVMEYQQTSGTSDDQIPTEGRGWQSCACRSGNQAKIVGVEYMLVAKSQYYTPESGRTTRGP
jgi:hypothetical protein